MKRILALLFVLISSSYFAQQTGNWKIYTSMSSINDFVFSDSFIWGATTGGAFQFSAGDSSYKKFTKVEGLTGINVTATAFDNIGNVWFGSSNGALDVLNINSSKIGSVTDILNSDKTNKQINSLQSSGDTVIASTDFGITLIDPKNDVLYDTFFKFDYLSSNSKINFAVKYDLIYAASDQGVIIQKAGATNLSAPESWKVYNVSNGLPSNKINKIVKYGNSIIAASDKGLSKFNGQGFETYISQLINFSITDLFVYNDTLYILASGLNVYTFANDSLVKAYSFSSAVKNIKVSPHYGLMASGNNGVSAIKNSVVNYVYPNGPLLNRFYDLGIDNDGTLWVGSGTDVSGVGFYSLSNNYWTNYNTTNNPVLPTNAYFKVYCAPTGMTYIGSWGEGSSG
jgi:ligand-binding sensor domain-containing protein